MTTAKTKLPLFIKIPAILAGFLALFLIFTIFFEKIPDEKNLRSCKIQKQGEFKEASMVTHLFRDAEGGYIAGMLGTKKDTWLVSKFLFSADFTPYLEPLSTKENYLIGVGETTYQLMGTFDDWAFVKTGQERIIPVQIKDGKIFARTSFGLCGGKWNEEAKVSRLNNKMAVMWDSKGHLGFYSLSALNDLVPREMPKSPDTLMAVETGNTLKVETCQSEFSNSKARIRIVPGIMAFTSGETRNIAAYRVSKEAMDLKAMDLKFKTEQFSDFFVTENSFIGFKVSDWLDRNETWKMQPIEKSVTEIKDLQIGQPLDFKSDYVGFDEPEKKSFWIAEKWKKWGFMNRYVITHVENDGSKENFELTDENAEKALSQKGLWKVLPGNRHLFIANKGEAPVNYSLIECGL